MPAPNVDASQYSKNVQGNHREATEPLIGVPSSLEPSHSSSELPAAAASSPSGEDTLDSEETGKLAIESGSRKSTVDLAKPLLKVLGTAAAWMLVAIGTVTYAGGIWIVKTFGYITPNQLRLNIEGVGADGVGGQEVVRSGITEIVVVPLLIVLVLFGTWLWVRNRLRQSSAPHVDSARQKRANVAVFCALGTLSLVAPAAGAVSLGSATQLPGYLASLDADLDVGHLYAVPVVGNEEQPLYNLVLIYLESIEDDLANEEIIGMDLLAGIEDVTGTWDRVDNLEQYKNFGWTMAGIVSTQCGVPLRAPSSKPIDESAHNDAWILNDWEDSSYMDGAVCLGDVLEKKGYRNVFMGGAMAAFAGKGSFLSSHGYQEVRAGEEWASRDDIEMVPGWWGPSDGALMQLAEEQILALQESEQPFSLTLLTVDTHEPATNQSYCEVRSDFPMEDIVTCSLDRVADFLRFLEDRGFMEDTVVVVMGDHLRMAGALDDKLSHAEDRTVFNRIHVPDDKDIVTKRTDQFAMFPTILEALGIPLEGGRAGLGVSAYRSSVNIGTLRALSDEDRVRLVASRSQDFYDMLWNAGIPNLAGADRE